MCAKNTDIYTSQPCAEASVGGEDAGILKVFALTCFPDIHYFHCLRIVDLLKGTEASTKNIFGRYSSQRMKASVGKGGNGVRASLVSLRIWWRRYTEHFLNFPSIPVVYAQSSSYPWVHIFRPTALGIAHWRRSLTIKWMVQPVLRRRTRSVFLMC